MIAKDGVVEYHRSHGVAPHVLMPKATWESLKKVLGKPNVPASRDISAMLTGVDVFVDECPCEESPSS